MEPRRASIADGDEIVRLAGVMYDSMGLVSDDEGWRAAGVAFLAEHLERDAIAMVVDAPDGSGGLVASAVGMIVSRLPTPRSPNGRFGYIGWVCTEPAFRGLGLARAMTDALLAWFATQEVGRVELHATAAGAPVYLGAGFHPSPFPHLMWRSEDAVSTGSGGERGETGAAR